MVPVTPPTTRLSAQTVGGGSGFAAESKGTWAYYVLSAGVKKFLTSWNH